MTTDDVTGLVALALTLLVCALLFVRRVPAGTTAVVERAGQVHRLLPPGVYTVTPFRDRVLRVSTRARCVELRALNVITADHLLLRYDVDLWASVVDPARADYRADYRAPDLWPRRLEGEAVLALRTAVSTLTLEQALVRRAEIVDAVRAALAPTAAAYGAAVARVEIIDADHVPPATTGSTH